MTCDVEGCGRAAPYARPARLCKRHYDLTRLYGAAIDDLVAHEARTRCDTCHRPATCVDHDHETGIVRGHLCHHCNLALGHAGDSPDRLRVLAAYIERHASSELTPAW